ncbi:MAG: hypothetical protein PHC85_01250 [Candidatus Pacebacteria bacterium]|nr:hypothetical protein [Candidatus Paceibacterota bacterium]
MLKAIKMNAAFFAKIIFVFVIFFAFVFYLYGRSKNFLQGPGISLDYPKNGETVNNPVIKIKGVSVNVSALYIDGSHVLTDSLGNFEKDMILAQGYNIIEVKAEDRFGRTYKQKIEVVMK